MALLWRAASDRAARGPLPPPLSLTHCGVPPRRFITTSELHTSSSRHIASAAADPPRLARLPSFEIVHRSVRTLLLAFSRSTESSHTHSSSRVKRTRRTRTTSTAPAGSTRSAGVRLLLCSLPYLPPPLPGRSLAPTPPPYATRTQATPRSGLSPRPTSSRRRRCSRSRTSRGTGTISRRSSAPTCRASCSLPSCVRVRADGRWEQVVHVQPGQEPAQRARAVVDGDRGASRRGPVEGRSGACWMVQIVAQGGFGRIGLGQLVKKERKGERGRGVCG